MQFTPLLLTSLTKLRVQPSGSGQHGRSNANLDVSGTLNGGSGADYSHYTSHATASVSDQYAGVSPLARRIVEYIATQPATQEGVHVAKIAREVKADAGAIRYCPFIAISKHCR